MDVRERNWLFVLVAVFLVFNIVTLSPLVPWQRWLFWSKPTPDRTISVEFGDYQIRLPPEGPSASLRTGIEVKVGQYVEFVATSDDVTYGFGVFRQDSTMVFQMQVLPGRENRIVWQFDQPGTYDVRSTEYSGPRHSDMHIPDAIRVTQ
jgi:cytochrome c oxidase subunit 2